MDEDEIADRRRHLEAEPADLLGQIGDPAVVVVLGGLQEGAIADRRDARLHGRQIHVERPAHPVDDVDDLLRPVHPAQTQSGEAVNLGEGAGDDHVLVFVHQPHRILIARRVDELLIGAVEHQQRIFGQALAQATHLRAGDPGAGGIVGIGQEDDLRVLAGGLQQGVHVGGVVGLRRRDDLRARLHGHEAIDQEAVLGLDDLVAGIEIGPADQLQQFIRAGAADDAGRVELFRLGDGFAQLRGAAVGIDVQRGRGLLERLGRFRAAAQRVLVRRQLGRPFRRGGAGDVGLDVEKAGAGLQRHGAPF